MDFLYESKTIKYFLFEKPLQEKGACSYVLICLTTIVCTKILNNSYAIVTYMKTEKVSLQGHIV